MVKTNLSTTKIEEARRELFICFEKQDIIFGRYVSEEMNCKVKKAMDGEIKKILTTHEISLDEAKNLFPIIYKTAGWRGQENTLIHVIVDT